MTEGCAHHSSDVELAAAIHLDEMVEVSAWSADTVEAVEFFVQTLSTEPYFSWSGSGIDSTRSPFNACSPNLVQLHDYYRRTWGAQHPNLGCHVPPPASTKSHQYGAATDERFPNRQITVDVMGWTIAHSAELGINTIHDYITQQMWKPLVGWRSASIGSPGGDWIHVETTPAAFMDGRPVEDRLQGGTVEMPLTGDDAKLAAAVNWEWQLTAHGATAPARVWLTDARELARQAAEAAGDANARAAKAVEGVDALKAELAEIKAALAAGGIGDPDQLRETIGGIVREQLNATRLTGP
jgi:hypothetical protein